MIELVRVPDLTMIQKARELTGRRNPSQADKARIIQILPVANERRLAIPIVKEGEVCARVT
jgi:hypothetical protein